jgi:hypothetical protein
LPYSNKPISKIYNNFDKPTPINTHLMFRQMFAPRGEKTLFLEDKRMIKFIYQIILSLDIVT